MDDPNIKWNEPEFFVGYVRTALGHYPKPVMRWNNDKVKRRILDRTAEKYFRDGKWRRSRDCDRFLKNLSDALDDIFREFEEEKENTPGI